MKKACLVLGLMAAAGCFGAGLDSIAAGLAAAPPVTLHPALDVMRLATAPADLVAPRAFMADAAKARRRIDTVMAPWTTPCPKLKGSWVRWLNPAGSVAQILFPATQLRLADADLAAQIAAARADRATTLGIEAQLVSEGKATWLNPLTTPTGDRTMLEGLRFVLSVDDVTFIQVAVPPTVTITDKQRGLWTGVFGGPKSRTDYIAAVKVTFPLRDANQVPLITDQAKTLALLLVGPDGDVDKVPMDLSKLPATLPVLPPPPVTPAPAAATPR
ncbi:MAG: hypothetical protein HZB16_14015 [Armatimonadetes bacterium]|nr:hypothetical protein [Armatimonadota bacterium]